MLRRNGPVVKSVESVLRLEGSLWGERFVEEVGVECRCKTCCTWLAENIGRKKWPKIRHLGTIAQLCSAMSSQLRHVSTIGKKLV